MATPAGRVGRASGKSAGQPDMVFASSPNCSQFLLQLLQNRSKLSEYHLCFLSVFHGHLPVPLKNDLRIKAAFPSLLLSRPCTFLSQQLSQHDERLVRIPRPSPSASENNLPKHSSGPCISAPRASRPCPIGPSHSYLFPVF
uniref:Uncharacterized protein n=1 Tax=Micrurus corallinus TaxID=54390 RepID=A0A2D4FJ61_MICCO